MFELVQQNVNGRRTFLMDTLSLTRRLEGQGMKFMHVEALTSVIKEVINDSLENVSQSFLSNEKIRMSEMVQDANFSMFKYEVQNLQEVLMAAAVIARQRGCSLLSINNQVWEMFELVQHNVNERRAFLVDTLNLSEMVQDANLSKFKSEV